METSYEDATIAGYPSSDTEFALMKNIQAEAYKR
jgi:hypothetical protein